MKENFQIVSLSEHPEVTLQAAKWFHQKWDVPESAYLQSMEECQQGNSPVPQWYVVMEQEKIVAGIGVIENDFHVRKDLTPNVCALYVEKEYRKQGIAGELLQLVCDECLTKGIDTLYLVTEHTSFYERYGWEFFCMVQEVGSAHMTRMYRHTC